MRDNRYSHRTWSLLRRQQKWQFYAAVFGVAAVVFGGVVRPTIHDLWAIIMIGPLFLGMFACLVRVAGLAVAVVRSAKQDKADREAA